MNRITTFIAVCILLAGSATICPAATNGFKKPDPGIRIDLPRMLYAVPEYRTQWWYFTGHLNTDRGRYGYEVTFFRVGVTRRDAASRFAPNTFFFLHAALTDITGKQYHFFDEAARTAFDYAGAATNHLDVHIGNARLTGDMTSLRLTAETDDFRLDLTLTPEKPAVLHGQPPGYSRKSATRLRDASYYFSFTRLATTGTLTLNGTTEPVSGQSWFDRELFTDNEAETAGWDWFSIQLDDGRELMLYLLRKPDGSIDGASSGTFVRADGSFEHLPLGAFTIEPIDFWRSPHTGAVYPAGWRIRVPDESIDLRVTPSVADQEFRAEGSTRNVYWEGACTVSGSASGQAYVELTGYDNDQ